METGLEQPIVVRATVQQFGWAVAGALLQASLEKFVAKELNDPFLEHIVADLVYVDNVPISSPMNCPLATNMIISKIREKFKLYNFPLDDLSMPGEHNQGEDRIQTCYGVSWDKQDDTIVPAITLSLHPSHKGRRSGPNLEDDVIRMQDIILRHLARIAGQTSHPSGTLTEPLAHSNRQKLSLACLSLPSNAYDTPLYKFDENLATECAEYLNTIKIIKKYYLFQGIQ